MSLLKLEECKAGYFNFFFGRFIIGCKMLQRRVKGLTAPEKGTLPGSSPRSVLS